MPGLRVLVYLPKRSTVNSRPCGTILITLIKSTMASSSTTPAKMVVTSIRILPEASSLPAARERRHRNRRRLLSQAPFRRRQAPTRVATSRSISP